MNKIKILDKDMINKISAGEVIERPASIVKELMENSIDAKANEIIIEVKDGGKDFIKVIDNGIGMSKNDARICFLKHSTSKLKDLFAIENLGFRGEALASISAISNFKLATNNGDESIVIKVEAGKFISETETGMSRGTISTVRDLFFNTPARKKYMKSYDVELSHITDIVIRYSLANQNISFKLISDGKEVIMSGETTNLLNKIVSIYGKEVGKQMIPVNYSDDLFKISGYIGKPYLTRNDRVQQSIFINKRYVKSQSVSSAIYDAYHTLLFLNRHPVIVLNIEIDFSLVDVNVHPTKNIVRIEKEKELNQAVFKAIRESFIQNDLIPEVSVEDNYSIPNNQYMMVKEEQKLLEPTTVISSSKEKVLSKIIETKIGLVFVLGQINRTYILAESVKGLLIIDQHALQERVFFDRLWGQYKDKKVEIQKLLKSIIIELGPNDAGILNLHKTVLNNLGFGIEEYGTNSFILRTIPKIMTNFDKTKFIQLISDLKDGGTEINNINEERITQIACKKAVKAGDILSKVEIENLIKDLDSSNNPFSCPHGRPTMITISLSELEKKFKRKG